MLFADESLDPHVDLFVLSLTGKQHCRIAIAILGPFSHCLEMENVVIICYIRRPNWHNANFHHRGRFVQRT